MSIKLWHLGFVCAALVFGAGCGGMQIQYKPLTAAAPEAKSSLAVEVVDARPADHGGEKKREVGQVRGSFGIPSGVEDSKEDVAPRTVGDATQDALRHAGVGVKAGGGKKLLAIIKEYWMDGMVGYASHVTVHYDLKDASGKSLWASDVDGGSGGVLGFSPTSMTKDLFERALSDLATKAEEQFQTPQFQQAIAAP